MTALVKVGTNVVNSIETTHNGEKLNKGEQMAYFTFGSTVVLLFEKKYFQPASQYRDALSYKIWRKDRNFKGTRMTNHGTDSHCAFPGFKSTHEEKR